MSDKQSKEPTKELELHFLTQEIERLNIRRQSIQGEIERRSSAVIEAPRTNELRGAGQPLHQESNRAQREHQSRKQSSCRKHKRNKGAQAQRSREVTIREQYSARALDRFVRTRERLLREVGSNSKSRGIHRPLLDARQQELRIGDFVRALTTGRNYTDRGIVSRFSKDGSRVYFIDYLDREQNRAPENLAHVDE